MAVHSRDGFEQVRRVAERAPNCEPADIIGELGNALKVVDDAVAALLFQAVDNRPNLLNQIRLLLVPINLFRLIESRRQKYIFRFSAGTRRRNFSKPKPNAVPYIVGGPEDEPTCRGSPQARTRVHWGEYSFGGVSNSGRILPETYRNLSAVAFLDELMF